MTLSRHGHETKNSAYSRRGFWPELFITLFASSLILFCILDNSATIDERAHLACGTQLLSTGRYTYEAQHPPLARAIIALPPYIAGLRSQNGSDMIVEGGQLLFDSPFPTAQILFWSRIAVFPFFLLSLFAAYRAAYRIQGREAGLFALAFLALCPPVLTHAGLATTDYVSSVFLFLSFLSWNSHLETKSLRSYCCFFFSFTCAALSKVSMPVFFFAAVFCAAIGSKKYRSSLLERIRNFPMFLLLASIFSFFFIAWSMFGFSAEPIANAPRYAEFIAGIPEGWFRDTIVWLAAIPLPLSEYIRAFASVLAHNSEGHVNYFMGQLLNKGTHLYFPTLVALKIPELLSLLSLCALIFLRKSFTRIDKEVLYAVSIFFFACLSSITIGLRHILPVFFLFSIIFGVTLSRIWSQGKLRKLLIGLALGISAAELVSSRENILGYMNFLAPADKSYVTVDSDFEWGQLTNRVVGYLQQNQISSFSYLLVEGGEIQTEKELRGVQLLPGQTPGSGWLVVSRRALRLHPEFFRMLSPETLREVIAGTVEIHRVP